MWSIRRVRRKRKINQIRKNIEFLSLSFQLPQICLALASVIACFHLQATAADEGSALIEKLQTSELAGAESQQVAFVADHDLDTAAGWLSIRDIIKNPF